MLKKTNNNEQFDEEDEDEPGRHGGAVMVKIDVLMFLTIYLLFHFF